MNYEATPHDRPAERKAAPLGSPEFAEHDDHARLGYEQLGPEHTLHGVGDEDRRLRRRNIIFLLIAAAVVLCVWLAVHHGQKSSFDADPNLQAPTVTVIVPGRTSMAGTINATGALAARHEMPVGSVGDGGQITAVLVNAGQWVRRGQLLATIDRSVAQQQLANQQAQIEVAAADARLAQANLDRAEKLVDRGFISKANIDQLIATRDAANGRVRVAQAMRGEMAAKLHRLDILAPADGLVLERDVEPGQVVGGASGVLFRIAENGAMELRAKLSEAELAQLTIGEPADVTPVGAAGKFTGTIWQLAPMIDATSRQGMARIALPYAPGLRPGGFASAVLRSGSVVATQLPESALQADSRGSFVYVIGAKNRAERRPVKLGMITDGGVAVTGGLVGNERVVLRAGAFLSEGETVNPKIVGADKS